MKYLYPNFNLRKAQSAIEFLILVMTILFLFVSFLYFIQSKIADSQYEILSIKVKEIALRVQDEINLAQGSTNGYFRVFNIPSKINGLEYQIELVENSVYVRTDNGKHAVALPIVNVTGNIIKGDNQIYKTNGTIFLN